MPNPGDAIGKYTLGKKLGEGAFGVVFAAHDAGLDRDVALKFLHPHQVANPQVFERFVQEARAVAKLSHPGIVTVHELSAAPDGTAFIAMELLQGESLASRIRRVGKFSADAAREVCRQVAATIYVAHQAGIVHRDLKPDNLFLIADPAVPGRERVKVLDFGIAKLTLPDPMKTVNTGAMVIGTPYYMSPEQCTSSSSVDHRTDIYSLGCVLYELVCGQPPFTGRAGELIAKHQLAEVPDAHTLVPDLPRELGALIARMLAKEPEQRPQTMQHVQSELTGAPSALPNTARGFAVSPPKEHRTTLSSGTSSTDVPVRSRRVPALIVGGLLISSAGIGAALAMFGNSSVSRDLAKQLASAAQSAGSGSAASARPAGSAGSAVVAAQAVEPAASGADARAESGQAISAGHLTPDWIAAEVRSRYATAIKACYDRYARANRTAARTLAITLHVALTGQVMGYATTPVLDDCDALAKMQFAPDATVDDPEQRIEAKLTFDYPAAHPGAVVPARAAHSCPAGSIWNAQKAACVPPADKKPCPPIKDRIVDPFSEDPCHL